MSLPLALALIAAQAAGPEPAPPPEAMIDFLGRRRLCLALPPLANRTTFQQAESRRLACDALPGEERRWRETARGDAAALGWLDSDPRDFRLPAIIVSSAAGPPGAYVHRLLWTGTDNGGVVPFRLEVDSDADNGATTVITASFGDLPARSFRLDNARFAWLDLQGVRAALDAGGADLRIDIRYGFRRGYCGDRDSDDRPSLSLVFARDGVSATDQDRANCGMTRRPLSAAAPGRPTPR
jgi:hypothetical protein